jgi:hypothetical protein
MNKTTIKAYAQIIHAAAMNRRAALQTELAVGFAVLLDSYPSKRLARAQLQKIYDDAGCKCATPSDVNWKSINRRIAASSALFDFMGHHEVREWAGDLTKGPLIEALVKRIEPLKLNTVNEVLIVCKGAKAGNGEGSTVGRKPGQRVETAHLKFSVPPATTPEELLEVGARNGQYAPGRSRDRDCCRRQREWQRPRYHQRSFGTTGKTCRLEKQQVRKSFGMSIDEAPRPS